MNGIPNWMARVFCVELSFSLRRLKLPRLIKSLGLIVEHLSAYFETGSSNLVGYDVNHDVMSTGG